MDIDKKTEERIRKKAIALLENTRPGWDIPHTKSAVYWMKKLITAEGGDEKILVTTMWLHDIGYRGLLEKGYNFEQVMARKEEHMEVGAGMAKKILEEMGFDEDEVKQIVHLISVHDRLNRLSTKDEMLVMEADSLAQVDVDNVKPNFDKENYLRFLKHFEEERVPRFRTETGKRYLKEILAKAKAYFT